MKYTDAELTKLHDEIANREDHLLAAAVGLVGAAHSFPGGDDLLADIIGAAIDIITLAAIRSEFADGHNQPDRRN